MAYDVQYDNPKLWTLVSDKAGKDYVSVPTEVPWNWPRELPGALNDIPAHVKFAYVCGEYMIYTFKYGSTGTSYTVLRQGVELPLSLYGRLKDAKGRARQNARGEDRMHLA